jgi:hypothetical protein
MTPEADESIHSPAIPQRSISVFSHPFHNVPSGALNKNIVKLSHKFFVAFLHGFC